MAACLGCALANCIIGGLLNIRLFQEEFTIFILESVNFAFNAMGICAVAKISGNWYDAQERGMLAAVFATFASLGIFLSFSIGSLLTDLFAWWTIFVVPGLTLCAAASFVSDIDDHPVESSDHNFRVLSFPSIFVDTHFQISEQYNHVTRAAEEDRNVETDTAILRDEVPMSRALSIIKPMLTDIFFLRNSRARILLLDQSISST